MKKKYFLLLLIFVYLFATISVFSIGNTDTINIEVQIDHKTAKINGKEVSLDAPPILLHNRTFVPLRFISEAFGATINWDSVSQTVTILLDNPEFYRNKSVEQGAEIDRLNELIRSKDQSIKSLSEELKQKNSEIEILKTENTSLKNEIVTLKKEIENLKKGINTDIEYKNIQILVNGRKIASSLEPFLFKGKVFAAIEDICKSLGKTWKWDSTKNIFYIDGEPEEDPSPLTGVEKIGVYTNSFGYYIYVADPIKNRVLKYSTEGLFLDTIIKPVSTHTSGEKWELKKVVDVTTCRLTDVIGIADAGSGLSYIYEMTGHTHHKNGQLGSEPGQIQELWGIAMTETNETKSQALLDRKGCKVSHWNPPPGGIKDPSDGLFDFEFGSQGSGDGELMFPEGICYDKNQNLWVADTGNSRVVEFSFKGSFIRNLTESFIEPCAVGVDFLSSQGSKLYVLDRGAMSIFVFSKNLERLKTLPLKHMKRPSSLTIDADNNIWVTDISLNKAFKFNQAGEELLVINNLLNPPEVKRSVVRVFVGKYIMTINDIIKAYEVPPFVEDDQTYIPVSAVSKGLGAEIVSENIENTLTVIFDDTHATLTKGDLIALVDGKEITLTFPPILKKNRLFITKEDYGMVFPVSVTYKPLDLRYSSASVTFIFPK